MSLVRLFISLLLILTCAVTLLNSNAYGSQSLIALFFYCILATFTGAFIFIIALAKNRNLSIFLPLPIILFIAFTLYVLLHGMSTNTLGLTHFYWFSSAVFLVGVYYWRTISVSIFKISKPKINAYFYRGITIVALIESVIVVLQFIKMFPVPNALFRCTGTWANPNVTAMFLSVSLYAIIDTYKQADSTFSKRLSTVSLVLVLLAIVFLMCRSAYIVAALFVLTGLKPKLFSSSQEKGKQRGLSYPATIAIVLFITLLLLALTFKQTSSVHRLAIWKESAQLVAEKPLWGNGFGMFEKEYNLFAAQQQNVVNEHVNMPYNDFLELAIDGGIVAVVLWLGILVSIGYHCIQKTQGRLLPVLISFCVIQLTNFGFQAIPVFVLFLMYMGLEMEQAEPSVAIFSKLQKTFFAGIVRAMILFCISAFLCVTVMTLSSGFFKKWQLSKMPYSNKVITQYQLLNNDLHTYSSYQESYGDLYMSISDYRRAVAHYQLALKRSSRSELFAKTGYCYQALQIYDSSEYYYKLTEHMEPHKFMPHLALLRLYQQKQDTASILSEAHTIMAMPVKVDGERVHDVLRYADSTLKKINTILQ